VKLFTRIRIPLLLALLNGIAWSWLGPHISHVSIIAVFNAIRLVLIFWAGALALEPEEESLLPSAIAGVLVFATDHLLVAGAFFLLDSEFAAALGVLMSFIVLGGPAMLLGALAGVIRRRKLANVQSSSI
jgi:hypothetical protein